MIEVYKNLYVGDDNDCQNNNDTMAIIHACKTCHQNALHYAKSLPQSHPNYLVYEQDFHLFVNLVDMPREFSPIYTDPIMKKSMDFIDTHIENTAVLIHCNQGMSRSPSIALLWLAKNGLINNASYEDAREAFTKLYEAYDPGNGILLYMAKHWQSLIGNAKFVEDIP